MADVRYVIKGRRRPASPSRAVIYHMLRPVLGKDYMPWEHSVERWNAA